MEICGSLASVGDWWRGDEVSICRMSQTVSMITWKSVFELLTVLCPDSATSTEGSEGSEKVGADHKSVLEDSKPNTSNKVTQRRIGQRLSSNCAFKEIERISIRDGGASDHVRVEVANHDDSRGAPNTISWRHDLIWYIWVDKPQSCLYKQDRGYYRYSWTVRAWVNFGVNLGFAATR